MHAARLPRCVATDRELLCAAKSVVQFGRGIYDGYESVVRFFTTIEAYHATMQLYLNSPLTDMMPKLIAYCDNFEGALACEQLCGCLSLILQGFLGRQ